MVKRKQLKEDLEEAKATIERIERKLELSEIPEPAVGKIIKWEKQFQPGGTVYQYVAVHTPVGWYIAGHLPARRVSWDAILDKIDGAGTVHIAVAFDILVAQEPRPFPSGEVGRASCGHGNAHHAAVEYYMSRSGYLPGDVGETWYDSQWTGGYNR